MVREMRSTYLTNLRLCSVTQKRFLQSCVILALTLNLAAGIKWSKMSIGPCSVPTRYASSNFCCRTQNVPATATIYFYYKSSYNVTYIATVHQPGCNASVLGQGSVTCNQDNNELVYNLIYSTLNFQNAVGIWGCRYYANESSYALKEYQVLTDNKGFKIVRPRERPVLTWMIYRYYSSVLSLKVISPGGLLLLNVSNSNIIYTADKVQFVGNLSLRNVSILLDNVLEKDNGTYTCNTTSNENIGITVVVLKTPLTPIISVDPEYVITSGYEVRGTITCASSSQSAAPMYYHATIQYIWIVPDSDANYSTFISGDQLTIFGVDCRLNSSLPVYCAAKENDERSYDSEPFYPHELCSVIPLPFTTSTPTPNVKKHITTLVGLLTFFIIAFVFTLVISFVVGRKRVKKKMKKCYKRCCCKGDLDSDDEVMLNPTSRNRHRGLEDGLFQENDPHLQTIIDQIAREESRQAREVNRPAVNGPPEFFNVLAVQDSNQSNSANENQSNDTHVEDQPDHNNDVNETSEGASNDTQEQGATYAGVAAAQLLTEVESRLEEFNQSLGEQALQIVVNRDNIVNNLICYYTDPIVPQSRVQVKMFDENGIDAGGITADMYTSFWVKAQEQFFIGCENVVPYLPAHKMVEEEIFRVLGSILSHSVALLKTIPIPLCKTTIIVMIYDTLDVAKETLLKDFLLFIDSADRNLISKALSNYSSLSEEEQGNLQSIFARYDYAGVIKESNFVEHLVLLARNEICRKPKPLCELMRAGIPSIHMDVFWSLLHPDHLNILYVALRPTATRIIARLHIDGDSTNLSRGQQRAFQYLKNLLNELSPEELENFIQFVTGRRSTPRDPIMVSFTTSRGFQRMPKAHTCSNLLELPATYEDYNAFKNEFKHLLASDEAMIMTME